MGDCHPSSRCWSRELRAERATGFFLGLSATSKPAVNYCCARSVGDDPPWCGLAVSCGTMFAKRALTALRAGLPQLRRHRTTSAPAALVSSKRCRPLLSRACPLKVHPTAHFSSIARSETTSQAQDAGDLPYETERERLRWRRKPSKVLIVKKISSKFADSMARPRSAF